MIKGIIAGIIVIAVVSAAACAKSPQPGDHVRLAVSTGMTITTFEGTITSVGNSLICLKCSLATGADDKILWSTPRDMCVGAGSIAELLWIDNSRNVIEG